MGPFFVGLPGDDQVFIAFPRIGQNGKIVYWVNVNGSEILFEGNPGWAGGGPFLAAAEVPECVDDLLLKEIARAIESLVIPK